MVATAVGSLLVGLLAGRLRLRPVSTSPSEGTPAAGGGPGPWTPSRWIPRITLDTSGASISQERATQLFYVLLTRVAASCLYAHAFHSQWQNKWESCMSAQGWACSAWRITALLVSGLQVVREMGLVVWPAFQMEQYIKHMRAAHRTALASILLGQLLPEPSSSGSVWQARHFVMAALNGMRLVLHQDDMNEFSIQAGLLVLTAFAGHAWDLAHTPAAPVAPGATPHLVDWPQEALIFLGIFCCLVLAYQAHMQLVNPGGMHGGKLRRPHRGSSEACGTPLLLRNRQSIDMGRGSINLWEGSEVAMHQSVAQGLGSVSVCNSGTCAGTRGNSSPQWKQADEQDASGGRSSRSRRASLNMSVMGGRSRASVAGMFPPTEAVPPGATIRQLLSPGLLHADAAFAPQQLRELSSASVGSKASRGPPSIHLRAGGPGRLAQGVTPSTTVVLRAGNNALSASTLQQQLLAAKVVVQLTGIAIFSAYSLMTLFHLLEQRRQGGSVAMIMRALRLWPSTMLAPLSAGAQGGVLALMLAAPKVHARHPRAASLAVFYFPLAARLLMLIAEPWGDASPGHIATSMNPSTFIYFALSSLTLHDRLVPTVMRTSLVGLALLTSKATVLGLLPGVVPWRLASWVAWGTAWWRVARAHQMYFTVTLVSGIAHPLLWQWMGDGAGGAAGRMSGGGTARSRAGLRILRTVPSVSYSRGTSVSSYSSGGGARSKVLPTSAPNLQGVQVRSPRSDWMSGTGEALAPIPSISIARPGAVRESMSISGTGDSHPALPADLAAEGQVAVSNGRGPGHTSFLLPTVDGLRVTSRTELLDGDLGLEQRASPFMVGPPESSQGGTLGGGCAVSTQQLLDEGALSDGSDVSWDDVGSVTFSEAVPLHLSPSLGPNSVSASSLADLSPSWPVPPWMLLEQGRVGGGANGPSRDQAGAAGGSWAIRKRSFNGRVQAGRTLDPGHGGRGSQMTGCQLLRDVVACVLLVVVRSNATLQSVTDALKAKHASGTLPGGVLSAAGFLLRGPCLVPTVGHAICVGGTVGMLLAALDGWRRETARSCSVSFYSLHRNLIWVGQMCGIALLQQLCLHAMQHGLRGGGGSAGGAHASGVHEVGNTPDVIQTPEYLSHPVLSMLLMSTMWPLLGLDLGAYKVIITVRLLLTLLMGCAYLLSQCLARPELLLLLALRVLGICVALYAGAHEVCWALPRAINLAVAAAKVREEPLKPYLRLALRTLHNPERTGMALMSLLLLVTPLSPVHHFAASLLSLDAPALMSIHTGVKALLIRLLSAHAPGASPLLPPEALPFISMAIKVALAMLLLKTLDLVSSSDVKRDHWQQEQTQLLQWLSEQRLDVMDLPQVVTVMQEELQRVWDGSMGGLLLFDFADSISQLSAGRPTPVGARCAMMAVLPTYMPPNLSSKHVAYLGGVLHRAAGDVVLVQDVQEDIAQNPGCPDVCMLEAMHSRMHMASLLVVPLVSEGIVRGGFFSLSPQPHRHDGPFLAVQRQLCSLLSSVMLLSQAMYAVRAGDLIIEDVMPRQVAEKLKREAAAQLGQPGGGFTLSSRAKSFLGQGQGMSDSGVRRGSLDIEPSTISGQSGSKGHWALDQGLMAAVASFQSASAKNGASSSKLSCWHDPDSGNGGAPGQPTRPSSHETPGRQNVGKLQSLGMPTLSAPPDSHDAGGGSPTQPAGHIDKAAGSKSRMRDGSAAPDMPPRGGIPTAPDGGDSEDERPLQRQRTRPLKSASRTYLRPPPLAAGPSETGGNTMTPHMRQGTGHSWGGYLDAPTSTSGAQPHSPREKALVYKQWHDSVSVLFCDIVGYTSMSQELEPEQVMMMLHELFTKYDRLAIKWGVYKVETIGDNYMACTGVTSPDPLHAQTLVNFAADMVAAANSVCDPRSGKPVSVRVGINSGRVMSGIVGQIRARYCLFGDVVNTASRMESTGVPNHVQVSEITYRHLNSTQQQSFAYRGELDVKGKGKMRTYLLNPYGPSTCDEG